MNVMNVSEIETHTFSAHGGEGEINMKFAFTQFEGLDHSNWNFFGIAEFPVGATAGYHRHEGNDEWFYILSGEATITIDGESRRIKAGDVVLTRDGSSHGITNVTEKLVLIAVEIKTGEILSP